METLEYARRWSLFAPDFTYEVREQGAWIGEVARMEGQRVWHASNRSWSGGADLAQTFPTRYAAADALRAIANGQATLEAYGRASACMAAGRNHSGDTVELWHGLDTPAIACGFHAQHFTELVYAGHRAALVTQ
jgi:hypothetical protein